MAEPTLIRSRLGNRLLVLKDGPDKDTVRIGILELLKGRQSRETDIVLDEAAQMKIMSWLTKGHA